MRMHGNFYCCTAVDCHQCYFLQLMKHLLMLMWLAATHSSSNSITALCRLPQVGMGSTSQCYKAKMKKHYFPNDLLMRQYLNLSLCGPLPGCFSHRPVCSLTPPWLMPLVYLTFLVSSHPCNKYLRSVPSYGRMRKRCRRHQQLIMGHELW
jgi:hypothetical protein